jgi:sugar phosphate isomerase/epimerase
MTASPCPCPSVLLQTRIPARRHVIVNPPGLDARVHQHNEIGNGDIDCDETFAALRDVAFDGIAAVCVLGWEERTPTPSTAACSTG